MKNFLNIFQLEVGKEYWININYYRHLYNNLYEFCLEHFYRYKDVNKIIYPIYNTFFYLFEKTKI